jgi:hypothetical protein
MVTFSRECGNSTLEDDPSWRMWVSFGVGSQNASYWHNVKKGLDTRSAHGISCLTIADTFCREGSDEREVNSALG